MAVQRRRLPKQMVGWGASVKGGVTKKKGQREGRCGQQGSSGSWLRQGVHQRRYCTRKCEVQCAAFREVREGKTRSSRWCGRSGAKSKLASQLGLPAQLASSPNLLCSAGKGGHAAGNLRGKVPSHLAVNPLLKVHHAPGQRLQRLPAEGAELRVVAAGVVARALAGDVDL